jgi:eukaryotic-like serine/threonine-protein kinase
MDAETLAHWQAADAVFDQWLDLPHDEREAWLAAQTLPAPVQRRLEQLLVAHRQPRASLDPYGGDLAGCRLGGWTLETELGRGGMAVVYRGWREQGMARQQAAIKILTLGALGITGRDRFQREAAILARLNHPNITSLIDSGVADDGTCWLAMPLVEGERIDHWCESHALDTRAIVHLCLQICDAAAYAHRNLVIHRDLKPSNVLVEAGGHVRLLDFGIGQFTDSIEERTQTMLRAMTPGYAAPEQLRGALPSTAIDIYGLGALLHRLLTGRTPQTTAAGSQSTRPSLLVRADGDACHRHYGPLKNDLDRVLLKALSDEPEQRYHSAEALADDLRRWLGGLPVLAQKPRTSYRLRKFVGRHKVGVAATCLLLLTLTGGVATTLWQAGIARQEAANARVQAQRATLVRDFLQHVFESTNPDAGGIPTALDLLDEGASQARKNIVASDPLAAADILHLTGVSRLRLNRLDDAARDLEQALELMAAAGGAEQTLARQAAAIHKELARLHRVRGNTAEAIRHARAALALDNPLETPVADHLRAMNALGMALATTAPAEAEALHRQALARIAGSTLENSRLHLDTLNGLSVSIAMARPADFAERLLLVEARLRLVRALDGEDSGSYAYTAADASTTMRKAGRLERAETLARQAVEITDRIYTQPHMHASLAHCNLAAYLMQRGRHADALAHYETSSAIDDRIHRMDLHAESCYRGHAYVLTALNRPVQAAEVLGQSAAIISKHGLSNKTTSLAACGLAASIQLRTGKAEAATRTLEVCAPPTGIEPPLAYRLAQAERHVLDGKSAEASWLLADLRNEHPPGNLARDWQRPWMLSLLLARDTGDAAAETKLLADLGDFADITPLAHCIAATSRARCTALP